MFNAASVSFAGGGRRLFLRDSNPDCFRRNFGLLRFARNDDLGIALSGASRSLVIGSAKWPPEGGGDESFCGGLRGGPPRNQVNVTSPSPSPCTSIRT